jgi:hypothetical protein
MTKREFRIKRLKAVAEEYRAAQSAATLLGEELKKNPSFGDAHGWSNTAGKGFQNNLEATFIVRLYAEFEATLRDYWEKYRERDTRPPMYQLLRHAIPDQRFRQDDIDNADDVRIYRNHLIHDSEDEPPEEIVVVSVRDAELYLRTYLSRMHYDW